MFLLSVTYIYGEPLCVLQIAEYFVGRQNNAFIHGVSTCAAVNYTTFRHGRRRFDAACQRAPLLDQSAVTHSSGRGLTNLQAGSHNND